MRALKLRTIGWIYIFLIFIDMIETIIGVGIIGTKEGNPIGFNLYLLGLNYLLICLILIYIKHYDKWKRIYYDLCKRKTYKYVMIMLIVSCSIRLFVVLQNLLVMYVQYHKNFG